MDKQLTRLSVGLLTFLAISGYLLVWVWQGLDITDEGYNLTRHLQIANDSPRYEYGMTWLSDWIGGFWLTLLGDPGLIGARLGWVVIQAVTGLAAYWILTSYFRPLPTLLATVGTAVAANYRGVMVINYNYVPAMILVAACGLILASQQHGSAMLKRTATALAAGVLLGLGVMAKFPLVLALAFPLFPPLVHWCCKRRDVQSMFIAGSTLLSSIITILICFARLHLVGRLDQYLNVFSPQLNEKHAPKYLLRRYMNDAVMTLEHVITLAVVITALAVIVHAGAARCRLKKMAPICFFLLLNILVFCTTFFVLGLKGALNTYSLALPGMACGLGIFCLLVEYYDGPREHRPVQLLSLLALGLCMPVVLMAGSNNGILQMRFGLWLIMPSGLLLLPTMMARVTARFARQPIGRELLRCYVLGAAAVVVLFAAGARSVNTYRDLPNRFRLTTQLQHPRLKYVHTSSQRAASVDELLRQIERRVQPGDEVLAYNCTCMIYYLTKTRPVLGWPWLTIKDTPRLRARLDELGTSRSMPALVVRAKMNPTDPAWAYAEARPPSLKNIPKLDIVDKILEHYGFLVVWSNKDFLIMSLNETHKNALIEGLGETASEVTRK